MSKLEKMFEKILQSPIEVRFGELSRVLVGIGYVSRPGKGSHTVFCHDIYPVIVVPHHSPVKRVYIEQVREILKKYLNDEKEYN